MDILYIVLIELNGNFFDNDLQFYSHSLELLDNLKLTFNNK